MKVTSEIVEYIHSNKEKTLRELQNDINDQFGVHLHKSTIEIYRMKSGYTVYTNNRKVTQEIADFLYQNTKTVNELKSEVSKRWGVNLSEKTIRKYRKYTYDEVQELSAYSWINNNIEVILLELFDEKGEFSVRDLVDTLYNETGRRFKEKTIESRINKYMKLGLIEYTNNKYKINKSSLAYKILLSD